MTTTPRLIFLDTETTGNTSEDRLCQLSYLYHENGKRIVHNELYKPPLPISVGAMAVHHITNKQVELKPAFLESPFYSDIKNLLESEDSIVIAQNSDFDIGMLKREAIEPKNVIDTLRVLRRLDPDVTLQSHGLQYLRYLLNFDDHITETIQAHDAFGDVLVLEQLFNYLVNDIIQKNLATDEQGAIDHMLELSRLPMPINKIMFGKYKGQSLTQILATDRGYLEWLLKEKKKAFEQEGKEEEKDWITALTDLLK